MALKVKFTHDGMAQGTELSFGDYFLARVGEDVVVSDEALERYERDTGNSLEEVLKDSAGYHVKHATKAEANEAFPTEEDEPEQTVLEDVAAINTEEGGDK